MLPPRGAALTGGIPPALSPSQPSLSRAAAKKASLEQPREGAPSPGRWTSSPHASGLGGWHQGCSGKALHTAPAMGDSQGSVRVALRPTTQWEAGGQGRLSDLKRNRAKSLQLLGCSLQYRRGQAS